MQAALRDADLLGSASVSEDQPGVLAFALKGAGGAAKRSFLCMHGACCFAASCLELRCRSFGVLELGNPEGVEREQGPRKHQALGPDRARVTSSLPKPQG